MTERPTLKLRHPEPEVAAAHAAADGAVAHVKPAAVRWVIYRRVPKGYKRGGQRLPRFHHDTLESAQAEAARLARENPNGPFVILQEQFEVWLTDRRVVA